MQSTLSYTEGMWRVGTIYAEFSEEGLCIVKADKKNIISFEPSFIPLPKGINDDANSQALGRVPSIKVSSLFSSVVLVANNKKAAIRMAEIPLAKKPLSKEVQWDLVESAFPIGEKMNTHTHIFDGSIFENDTSDVNKSCFFMTALPMEIADNITIAAIAVFGNVHALRRLDTIEHFLFRYYAAFTSEPLWVIFPQGDGLRVLHSSQRLPQGAYIMSNHPELREDEIGRAWEGSVANPETTPKRVILLELIDGKDWGWILNFFADKSVELDVDVYDFGKFISI